MNTFLFFLIYGFLQGLTEFLPVSSSGHLVLFSELLGRLSGDLKLEALIHFATLLSMLLFFRKYLIQLILGFLRPKNEIMSREVDYRWLYYILISSIITGSFALLIKDVIEGWAMHTPNILFALFLNGCLLISTLFAPNAKRTLSLPLGISFGLVQILALMPGISRSGITICFLIWCGVRKQEAFLFSFLASMPLMLAAGIYSFDMQVFQTYGIGSLGLGFLTAFLIGWICLHLLKRVVLANQFHWFGYYCILIAVIFYLI